MRFFFFLLITTPAFAQEAQNGFLETRIEIENVVYEGKATFANGVKSGPFEILTESTSIRGKYESDKLEGEVIEVGTDPNGKSLKKVIPYKNGLPHGLYQKLLNGKIVERGQYQNGKEVGKWLIDDYGKQVIHDYDKGEDEEEVVKSHPKTALDKKNEAYVRRLTNEAVQQSLKQREESMKRFERLQKCLSKAYGDAEEIVKCKEAR